MLNTPTDRQILAVVKVELQRILGRLSACRNRQYRERGQYAEDLGAAIARTEFLLLDIMAGLVSPAENTAEPVPKVNPPRIQ